MTGRTGGELVKRNYRTTYSFETINEALKAIEDTGMSIKKAADLFKIPRSTLQDKLNGRSAVGCSIGPKPVLGVELEDRLAQWIRDMARIGFPLRCLDLKETVKQVCLTEELQTPFSMLGPGKSWFRCFFKRHPDLKLKASEHHSMGRACVTEERIRGWFKTLHWNLRSSGNMGLLHEPQRWFNADEKPACLNPDGKKFLGVRGETTQNLETGGSSKEALTVLITYSASGKKPPQMVVFKLKRSRPSIEQSIPDGWMMAKSDSGWVNGSTFLLWLSEFYLWCVDEGLLPEIPAELLLDKSDSKEEIKEKKEKLKTWGSSIEKKIILLVDGFAAHLTIDASIFCEERGIFYYCLYPQATHICQPADVGTMSPLENFWSDALQKHKLRSGGKRVSKEEFTPLFKQALDQVSTETMVNSFRACGFCPLNPDAVKYSRLISFQRNAIKEREESAKKAEGVACITALKESAPVDAIEAEVSAEIVKKFNDCYNSQLPWTGALEFTKLYEVWRSLKAKSSITIIGAAELPSVVEEPTTKQAVVAEQPIIPATEISVEASLENSFLPGIEVLLDSHFHEESSPVAGPSNTTLIKPTRRPLRNITNISPETTKLLSIPESGEKKRKRNKLVNYLVSSKKFRDEKEGRVGDDDEDWNCVVCKETYSEDTNVDGPRGRWTTCDICSEHMHVHCIGNSHKKSSNIVMLSRRKEYPFVCETCVAEPI